MPAVNPFEKILARQRARNVDVQEKRMEQWRLEQQRQAQELQRLQLEQLQQDQAMTLPQPETATLLGGGFCRVIGRHR